MKWGIRKKYEDGRFSMPYSRFLGYDKGEDGTMVINEEQAKVVRRIFGLYISGRSPYLIARTLTEEGIPTVTGKKTWRPEVIRNILSNEKYSGSARLQKKYTVNYLTKELRDNNGEVPQYLVEDSHPAIIDPSVFEEVQRMMEERKTVKGRMSSATPFSSEIRCGCCGNWYGSKVWHSTDKYRKVIYQCNHKFDGGRKCDTPHFTEDELKGFFVKAVNLYCREKDEIIRVFEEIKDRVFDTAVLEKECAELETEMNVVTELIKNLISENARKVQDQKEYNRKYDALAERFEKAKAKHDEASSEISRLLAEREKTERFFRELKKLPDVVTDFNEDSWYGLVDFLTANADGSVVLTFKDGTEVGV